MYNWICAILSHKGETAQSHEVDCWYPLHKENFFFFFLICSTNPASACEFLKVGVHFVLRLDAQ